MTMPRAAAATPHPTAAAPPAAGRPTPRRSIAVVTHDATLEDTLRRALPERSVMAVATPFALADLLLQEHTAVVVLDALAVGAATAALVARLAEQFPELQLVVVGARGDEGPLAPLFADGRLFRFIYRPYSRARVQSVIEAALARAAGQHPPGSGLAGRRGTALAALLAAVALGAWLLYLPPPDPPDAAPVAATPTRPVAPSVAPVAPVAPGAHRAARHPVTAPRRDAAPSGGGSTGR